MERRPHTGVVSGSLAIDRAGKIMATTLCAQFDAETLVQIGRTALHAFAAARRMRTPLTELVTTFGEVQMIAVELRGGALVFLNPGGAPPDACTAPDFKTLDADEFILYLETYIECWKHFNQSLNLAKEGQPTAQDEARFLEVRSLVMQGVEVIVAGAKEHEVRREEVLQIVQSAPSLPPLAGQRRQITLIENQWHKVYLTLQAWLGRLKVQQQQLLEGNWNVSPPVR